MVKLLIEINNKPFLVVAVETLVDGVDEVAVFVASTSSILVSHCSFRVVLEMKFSCLFLCPPLEGSVPLFGQLCPSHNHWDKQKVKNKDWKHCC